MRLRCDSTHQHHSCSLILDWLGQHPGDHRAHAQHDLGAPLLASWPNDGAASRGVPVAGAAAPVRARCAGPRVDPAPKVAAAAPKVAARSRYAEEVTEWDLLPDA